MRSSALPFIPNRSRALALGIRAALLCLSLASVVPGAAMAQSATQQVVRSYDIPAGPLSSALSRFAGEAGVLL